MERRKNKLKEIIKRGDTALGTCVYSFSSAIIELAGFCGLDFCRIDNEHAWRQDHTGEEMLKGAFCSGIVPLLRVDKGYLAMVRKGLEAGAGGVIVPHITKASEVADIVNAAKFPPIGHRGYGGLCFSGQWGADAGAGWMQWSNEETLVIPMIEDVEAVENIEAIMSVPGMDGVFFGPADYSISVGVPLQTRHDIVMDAVQKTVDTANKYSKFVIFGAKYPYWEDAPTLKEIGVHAIEIGHDVSILATNWKRTIEAMRS
ncbi:MAG: HpcH/HpaI aldolase family protein [Planctomycetota bacterium]|jgi:4-hydroxy-2-oxoheptanedioate aldolase